MRTVGCEDERRNTEDRILGKYAEEGRYKVKDMPKLVGKLRILGTLGEGLKDMFKTRKTMIYDVKN